MDFNAVTPHWLTNTLRLRYPNVTVTDIRVLEFINGHATKARVKLTFDGADGSNAIPRQVRLKANRSGEFQSLDIYANEARFYREVRDLLPVTAPLCYLADWDPEGQGLVVFEDSAGRRRPIRQMDAAHFSRCGRSSLGGFRRVACKPLG